MQMRLFGMAIACLSVTAPAVAQVAAPPAAPAPARPGAPAQPGAPAGAPMTVAAMQAEHAQWERDAAQRIAEHRAAAATLTRIARGMRR